MTDDEKLSRKDRLTLLNIVRPVIIEFKKKPDPISPYRVATAAILKIDPKREVRKNYPLLYIASHLQFRQIAMGELRGKGVYPKPATEESAEEEAAAAEYEAEAPYLSGFELLQRHYPLSNGSGYLPLEQLSDYEALWNADQIERKGKSSIRHAVQLRRWVKMRREADEK